MLNCTISHLVHNIASVNGANYRNNAYFEVEKFRVTHMEWTAHESSQGSIKATLREFQKNCDYVRSEKTHAHRHTHTYTKSIDLTHGFRN